MAGFPCCCDTSDPCFCSLCNSNGCPDEFDITLSGHLDYYASEYPYPQCEECDNLDGTFTVTKNINDTYNNRCVWTFTDESDSNIGTGQNCEYQQFSGTVYRALRISKITLWLFYSYYSFTEGLETWRVIIQYQQGDLTYGASNAGWFNSHAYNYEYKSSTPISWSSKVNCNMQSSHSYSLLSSSTGTGGLICDADSLSVSVEVAD